MHQSTAQPQVALELLAPARDLRHGMVAIDYGADAVYIGGPEFGARSAVPNSIKDIAALCRYAHRFGARVYLAVNTLLYDHELEKARNLVWKSWEAGADAIIVQDMTFCEMELPPVPVHASTQTFNRCPEKARFFEQVGFSRLVVERAISREEIKEIRTAASEIEIEAFVHGAICVSYSGQCYLSQSIAGKSGNRGECLQPCRWDFDLSDREGKK